MWLPRLRSGVAVLAVLAAVLLVGAAAWVLAFDPNGRLPSTTSPATVAIFDRNGALLYESLDPKEGRASPVSLSQLPPNLIHATIATEDATFYDNPGIDPGAVLRAVVQNWRSEGVVSGGSTLTQQLARNLWMEPQERAEQSLWRKLREVALALRLSARMGKDEILELYLNSAPYGHQAVGVEAAARIYLGKPARDLDLAECALLAGLPQAPSAYDPFSDLSRARSRQRTVLNLMVRQGYVTEAEAEAASREAIQLAPAAFPVRAPHFVAYVRQVLEELYRLDPAVAGSLKVYTSLDLGLQEIAEATVRRQLSALSDKGVRNGALVAMNPATGELLAMVGSVDYFDRSIDGEVNVALAARQPGSSIKPILYAAALEQGVTPATVLYDVPTSFVTADGKSYSPENYDQLWHGPVSVREALANSFNLPAVALMQRVGVGSFLDMANRFGLTTLAKRGYGDLSLALGSGEVRLLDMVSAFATFATGGEGRDSVAILRVEDARGRVLVDRPAGSPRRVVSPQVAYLISEILSDNDARSISFGPASPLRLSRPAAAKTGTTTDWRDNWTVGYTPDLAVGVWVGNSDNEPMRGVSGISGAAPIWHDFMEEALKGRPATPFPVPDGLVRREVCPESGELPSPWCPSRKEELFLAGTEPSRTCSWHRMIRIDSTTGLLAGPECPPQSVEERVFDVVPPELAAWAEQRGIPQPPTRVCDVHAPSSPAGLSGRADSGTQLPGEITRAPKLSITSPSRGAVLQISPELPLRLQRLEISAVLSGVSGAAPRVELQLDGARLASLDAPPYRVTWQLVAGNHAVRAVALDPSGAVVAADEVEIRVEGGP